MRPHPTFCTSIITNKTPFLHPFRVRARPPPPPPPPPNFVLDQGYFRKRSLPPRPDPLKIAGVFHHRPFSYEREVFEGLVHPLPLSIPKCEFYLLSTVVSALPTCALQCSTLIPHIARFSDSGRLLPSTGSLFLLFNRATIPFFAKLIPAP